MKKKNVKQKVNVWQLLFAVKQAEKKSEILSKISELLFDYSWPLHVMTDKDLKENEEITSDELQQIEDALTLINEIQERHSNKGRIAATKYLKS